MPVWFNCDQVNLKIYNRRKFKSWIRETIIQKRKNPGIINIVFVSKEEILRINNQYLQHNYFTDIITFDYSERNLVSGDLFICIDVVKENAKEYSLSLNEELKRVVIHGILHLLGFNDKTEEEKATMRHEENLSLLPVKDLLIA